MPPTCTLTLINPNIVQLVDAPDDVVQAVRASVACSFGEVTPVSLDAPHEHIIPFTLTSDVFVPLVDKPGHVAVRRFACRLLGQLYARGWTTTACTDLQYAEHYATWFLAKTDVVETDVVSEMVCVAPRSWDLLTLVGMTDETRAAVVDGIDEFVDKKARPRADCLEEATNEVTLKGRPWQSNRPLDDVNARVLLIR